MEWLLSRIPELKKRAYLAKYLVKVDLPPEVAADPDVSELYDQVIYHLPHSIPYHMEFFDRNSNNMVMPKKIEREKYIVVFCYI